MFAKTPRLPQALPLSEKPVVRAYQDVELTLWPAVSTDIYRADASGKVSWKTRVGQMLLTKESVLFLDREGPMLPWRLVLHRRAHVPYDGAGRKYTWYKRLDPRFSERGPDSVYLSKFWTLRRDINEELDREFRRSPAADSASYPRLSLTWWVRGSREWMWVTSLRYVPGSRPSSSSCRR